jgi:hypothetical protein
MVARVARRPVDSPGESWSPSHRHAEPGAWCRNTGSGELLDHLDRQHIARRDL